MSIQFDVDDEVADIARRTTEFVRSVVLAEEQACGGSVHDGPELAQQYSMRSGRDISSLAFYQALGYLKLAVIAEGIHARHLAGQTVGAGFDTVGSAVPVLLQVGLDTLA